MDKYKIIALFGKSASGKDTIQKWMVSNLPNMKSIVSCTTRPKREKETDGIDYHFLTIPEFGSKIVDGSMLEATKFNRWFYGTPIEELDIEKINVGVFNINGIECLLQDDRLDILPIYIDCYDKIRLMRSLQREVDPDCNEICRRFLQDEKDFSNIEFDYITYLNIENDDCFNIHKLPAVADFINGQN